MRKNYTIVFRFGVGSFRYFTCSDPGAFLFCSLLVKSFLVCVVLSAGSQMWVVSTVLLGRLGLILYTVRIKNPKRSQLTLYRWTIFKGYNIINQYLSIYLSIFLHQPYPTYYLSIYLHQPYPTYYIYPYSTLMSYPKPTLAYPVLAISLP